MSTPAPFNFLAEYIERLLAANGLGGLTADQRARYIPQLVRQVEERLGLELMPELTDDEANHFVDLANTEDTTPAQWQAFWTSVFPDFEARVEKVLTKFASDARSILNAV